MDINYLKSLGFVEYKLDEIPVCYEIEFPTINRGISYYKYSDGSEKISFHEVEDGNLISDISKNYLERFVNHLKWQESEVLKILNTDIIIP